jgi:predicted Zn finger-like uncharacterized protein
MLCIKEFTGSKQTMRLICPNCDAQYEVPTEVVPTEGRDVQCSNCGQTWFQHHPDHMPPTEEEAAALAIPENEERVEIPTQPQRKEIDPTVADILRQEAKHEAKIRKQEKTGLGSQPDLGRDDDVEDEAARRAREARERVARMRGEEINATASAATLGSRRDLLPDIEKINSTLRSTNDRQFETDKTGAAPSHKKRGFKRGFLAVVIIAIISAVAYTFAPDIAKAVPQVDPYLSNFVALVDQARVWLDGQLQGLAKWLDATAASQNNG